MNDETGNNIPDEVSELSVPGTHFDRKPHIHHKQFVQCGKEPSSMKTIAAIVNSRTL